MINLNKELLRKRLSSDLFNLEAKPALESPPLFSKVHHRTSVLLCERSFRVDHACHVARRMTISILMSLGQDEGWSFEGFQDTPSPTGREAICLAVSNAYGRTNCAESYSSSIASLETDFPLKKQETSKDLGSTPYSL